MVKDSKTFTAGVHSIPDWGTKNPTCRVAEKEKLHNLAYNIQSINPFPHCTINWLNPQTNTSGGLPLLIPGGSVVKNLPANAGGAGVVGSIPRWERSTGGGNGNLLQYSCLENPMDRGPWWATVHGVTNSRTRFSVHAF